jgi:hypothetical protein
MTSGWNNDLSKAPEGAEVWLQLKSGFRVFAKVGYGYWNKVALSAGVAWHLVPEPYVPPAPKQVTYDELPKKRCDWSVGDAVVDWRKAIPMIESRTREIDAYNDYGAKRRLRPAPERARDLCKRHGIKELTEEQKSRNLENNTGIETLFAPELPKGYRVDFEHNFLSLCCGSELIARVSFNQGDWRMKLCGESLDGGLRRTHFDALAAFLQGAR